jgi:magnesium-protoporphyrin O-methyltransferase
MTGMHYEQRRQEIETYFDRTAADTWARLTSDAPVSRIRQTVRAGRDEMRDTLLSWLPSDLVGCRVLDAGCGTGAMSLALAARGADVVAIDLSPTLVDLAQQRLSCQPDAKRIDFRVGDMRTLDGEHFDFVVAMDSLIHYCVEDGVQTLNRLAPQVRSAMIFTFAPKTPLLALMHGVGRIFPRGDRAPAIEPVSPAQLGQSLRDAVALKAEWHAARTHRVASGFYTSQAMEMIRTC